VREVPAKYAARQSRFPGEGKQQNIRGREEFHRRRYGKLDDSMKNGKQKASGGRGSKAKRIHITGENREPDVETSTSSWIFPAQGRRDSSNPREKGKMGGMGGPWAGR